MQQVGYLAPLLLPGRGTARSAHAPAAVLVPREVNFGEITKGYTLTGKPAVKRQCMPRLEIDDSGHVLLGNQPRIFNKRKSTGRIDGLVALTMDIVALRAPNMVVDVDAMIPPARRCGQAETSS